MTGLKTLTNLPPTKVEDGHTYITLQPEDGKRLKLRYSPHEKPSFRLQWKGKVGWWPVRHHWDDKLWSDFANALLTIQENKDKHLDWVANMEDHLGGNHG